MINKPHMARRIIFCVISVCMMCVCIYWLDRLAWDTVFALIGVLFGGTLGAVTVLAALTIGPAAEFIEVKIKKFL